MRYHFTPVRLGGGRVTEPKFCGDNGRSNRSFSSESGNLKLCTALGINLMITGEVENTRSLAARSSAGRTVAGETDTYALWAVCSECSQQRWS